MGVEKIMDELATKGPVTAVFTVYSDFFDYKTGVYKHISGGVEGGHAVKIIGYGTEGGQDYWLVANSWGNKWGMQGFFKIAVDNQKGTYLMWLTLGLSPFDGSRHCSGQDRCFLTPHMCKRLSNRVEK